MLHAFDIVGSWNKKQSLIVRISDKWEKNESWDTRVLKWSTYFGEK